MKRQGSNRVTLIWIIKVVGKSNAVIAVLLLVQAVLGVFGVFYALELREIVNAAVAGNRADFLSAAWEFGLLVTAQIALRAIYRFLEEYARCTMENRFKERLFGFLLTKNYASTTAVHSGEWMNRLTSDTVVVADGAARILPGVSGMIVKMVGALLAILYLEPRFITLLAAGGSVLIFLTYAFRKVLKNLHKRIQEADGKLRVFYQEHLGNLLIIKTFAKENRVREQSLELMKDHKEARMKRSHFSNVCNIGFGAIMNGATVFGALYCGAGILNGTMSYGNLMAVLQLISQVQSPFANITGYFPKYYAMIASAERLSEAESFEDDYEELLRSDDEIEAFYQQRFEGFGLDAACFSYRSPAQRLVLDQLDLLIRKGEYVAFSGYSGCGKSTVLKLLMGLYCLDSGSCYLLLDGEKTRLTTAYRGLFAYVPQGNQLMCGTIREIVAFNDPEGMKREDDLKKALHIACADFVFQLRQGMDTVLGERGAGLSEGQMQRIAIARAIFSNRPILLLDEATSSLDEQTEERLLSNLRSMTDKTVVIVTHRLAVRACADRVIDFQMKE